MAETLGNYDVLVPLPYTSGKDGDHMSHFTARVASVTYELYRERVAPVVFIPGEGHDPSTADHVKDYFRRRSHGSSIVAPRVLTFPDLNGTQQQMDPIADLQHSGAIGKVLFVGFNFHENRAREIMDRWEIDGDFAEVEREHARIRQEAVARANAERGTNFKTKADRQRLIDIPQMASIARAEAGIPALLMKLDSPFGRRAPFARFAKKIMGPTYTDISYGNAEIGLVRVEKMRRKAEPIILNAGRVIKGTLMGLRTLR